MDFKEKKQHLDSLEELVRLAAKKLDLQLNVLLAVVSQQANNSKFKSHEEFLEELPVHEQQLQDTFNLIRSMLDTLKEHAQNKNIDLSAWSEYLKSEDALGSYGIAGGSSQSTLPEGNLTELRASNDSGTVNCNDNVVGRSTRQSSSNGNRSVVGSEICDIFPNENSCNNMEIIHRLTASPGCISTSSFGPQNETAVMSNVSIGNIINPTININYCYNLATETPMHLAAPKTIFGPNSASRRRRSLYMPTTEDITPPPSVAAPESPLQIPTVATPLSPMIDPTPLSPILIPAVPTPLSPILIPAVPTPTPPFPIPTVSMSMSSLLYPTLTSLLKMPTRPTIVSPLKMLTGPKIASPFKMPTGPTIASPLNMPTGPIIASPLNMPTGPIIASPLNMPTGPIIASPLKMPTGPTTASPLKMPTGPTTASPLKMPTENTTASPLKMPTGPTTASPLKMPTGPTTASPLKIPTENTTASPLKMPTGPTPNSHSQIPAMALSTMEQPPAVQDALGGLDMSFSPQSKVEDMEFTAETSPVTHILKGSPIGPTELSTANLKAGNSSENKLEDILNEFDDYYDFPVDMLNTDPAVSVCSPASNSCQLTSVYSTGLPKNVPVVSESPLSENSEADKYIDLLLNGASVHSQGGGDAQERMHRDWETFNGTEAQSKEVSGMCKTSNDYVGECQQSENLTLGKPYDVYLTHIEPDNIAWLQMHDCTALELQETLRQRISSQSVSQVNLVYEGLKVVALYKDDGCYYRAIVKKFSDSGALEVLYIDYGNSDVVKQKDLYHLPPDLEELPAMASSYVVMKIDNYQAKMNLQEDTDELQKILKPFIENSTPLKAVFEQLPEGLGCKVPAVQLLRYGVSLFTEQFFTQTLNSSASQTQMLSNNHSSNDERSVRNKTTSRLQEGSTSDNIQELGGPQVNSVITPHDINERQSSLRRREMQTRNTAQETMGPPRLEATASTEEFVTVFHSLSEGEKMTSLGNMNVSDSKKDEGAFIPLDDEEMIDLSESCMTCPPEVSKSFEMKSPTPNSKVEDTCSAPTGTRSRSQSRKGKSSDYVHSLVSLTKPRIELSAKLHPVILSYVESPNLFYLHLVNSETAEIDRFQDTMTNHYRFNNEILHLKQLPIDSIWAFRSKDTIWFRGLVLANVSTYQGSKLSRSMKFLMVDYGDVVNVKMKDVRVLHGNFTLMPMLAIPCRLAHLEASSVWQKHISSGLGKEAFVNECGGLNAVLHAEFVSVDESGTYDVVLQNSNGIAINFLDLEASSSLPATRETLSQVPQGRGRAKKRNVIKRCSNPTKLPTSGVVLAGVVSKVYSPSKFYVYFQDGLEDVRYKQKTDEASKTETLFTMTAAMFEHYEKSLPAAVDCRPVRSELTVVREENGESIDYCRVRVMDFKEENGVVLVNVFFIDHGEQSWVKQEDLRPMEPRFAELPPQVFLCSLYEVEPPANGWKAKDNKQFKELTSDVSLFVHVTSVDVVRERLSVVLYNTEHGSDININEMMKTLLRNVNN